MVELTRREQVLSAFVMIGWRQPTMERLLLFVLLNDQGNAAGTILSEREVNDFTGISRTMVYRHLGELVERRVLLQHAGGGPRGHAYRVNPRVREWLVPWLSAAAPARLEASEHFAAPSRSWLAKREIALGRIRSLWWPVTDPKTRSAARPVRAVTSTAARDDARLSPSIGAPVRAAEGPLVARYGARQELADERGTPSSRELLRNSRSLSERSSEAQQVLAAINEQGATLMGRPADEVCELVDGTDPAALIAKIRRNPGLKFFGYVDLVRQHVAAGALAPAATRTVRPPCDKCGGMGMVYDEVLSGAIRCPDCNVPCENGVGGAQ